MKKFSFGIVVSSIGVVASIVTIYAFVVAKSENIELEIVFNSFDRLTDLPGVREPDLSSVYYFKKQPVKNLWKVTIAFNNVKDKTIIGDGLQKNIIRENLDFTLPKTYKLLRSDKVYSDIEHQLYTSNHGVALHFNQWRKGEKVIYNLYIETPTGEIDKLFLKEKVNRQIIDGEVTFKIQINGLRKRYITENLPSFLRKIGYIFVLLVMFALTVFLGISLVLIFPSFQKRRLWRKANNLKYSHFISDVFKENEILKERYLKSPNELPTKLWGRFEGDKYPKMFMEVNNDTFLEIVILFTIIFAFESASVIVFIDLVQNFIYMW
ncbi:hypothetical protein [Leptospira licerasiae]|nr:hypothetical protein [Leptospira licerasiae]EIE03469.1 hypothetical protein LEP1GSC185_3537 [Leptospira licerasiae serovar Varillal str. VAR 010]